MMQHSHLLEQLLSGGFICEVTDSQAFRHLQDEQQREAIDQYLRPLNRRLASNPEGNVWFLAWRELTQPLRDQLSQQFKETLDSLIPMLKLLQLTQETMGHETVLTANDILNRHELAARIENNPSLREQLHALVQTRFFQSQSEDVAGQLKQVFERLRSNGYLHQPHKDRHHYVVTGKIDYLIDLTRFIREEENIYIEEELVPSQEELLA
ncbi:condensin complex protein MksE [Denitrificimonas caeni]|uniref:DUF4194 domain-containing protein n=1 Tax=Denitrificimonas caeni TaxID=521720 RepID=A0AAE9VLA7_9GAMM|nr:hypothetical protein [Denitrificimonas caeni]NLJ13325.1 hypothetical protein [Gammaproteobacteria bacterium]WBE24261.1 hypothetical protein O6P33_07685 [Denitrificimonas caeni]